VIKNFLICGWYGAGNVGDEAILYSIKKDILKEYPSANVKALSLNPKYTLKFLGIDAVEHHPLSFLATIKNIFAIKKHKELLSNIEWCDVLVFGGGGFLSDWNLFNPFAWLKYPLIAKLKKKKVIAYSIGAGPFFTLVGKLVVRLVMNRSFDSIIVRDNRSKEHLIKAGVLPKLIKVSADPVLRLDRKKRNRICVEGAAKKIGFIINPYLKGINNEKYNNHLDCFSKTIRTLVKSGVGVGVIPFELNADINYCREVIANSGMQVKLHNDYESLNELLSIVDEYDFIVSFRLHGGILAASLNIPFLAINYHHKGHEFCKMMGWDYFLDFGEGRNWVDKDLSENELLEMIYEGINNKDLADILIDKRSKYIDKLLINDSVLKGLSK
jgi:polysaccharide pyruvyl transferase CsaB